MHYRYEKQMEMRMFKIEKAAPEEVGAFERVSWPFKDMSVGDVVRIEDPAFQSKAQVACHVHGRQSGMKFKTKTIGGVLSIYRTS
jgi:hypothetical protein